MEFIPLGSSDLDVDNVKKAVDFSLSANLFNSVVENSINVPKTLNELTSEDVFTSRLSVDAALELRLPIGGDIESKVSRRIFIQEYSKFKDIVEGTQKVRYGVGIRWIVNIKIIDSKASITQLPFIAASVQFGYAEASARFQVIGLSSAEITNLLPVPQALNIDSYGDMFKAFENIKKQIYSQNTIVTPEILSVLGEVKDQKNQNYE